MTYLPPLAELWDGPVMRRVAGVAVLLLLLAPPVWMLLGTRYDFAVFVDRAGRVSFKGRFPAGYRPAVTSFFQQQRPPPKRLKVYGNWSGGRLRVRVVGAPSKGDEQRVRNFLMTTLRP